MKPETELSRAIQNALRAAGVWVVRIQSSGRRGSRSMASAEPGFPDLYLPALKAHLEVKLPGGKLSPEQQGWHTRARAEGLNVAVVTSVREALDVVLEWKANREHEKAMGWA